MNFEDALIAMKAGAKITHPHFEDDVYFQSCYIGLPDIYDDNGKLVKSDKILSIVKMKGDFQHEDMGSGSIDDITYPGTLIIKEKYLEKTCKHGILPQLILFLVMSDKWEIFKDGK